MLANDLTQSANSNFYNKSMSPHSNLGMSPWKSSVMRILNRYHERPRSLDVLIDHETTNDHQNEKAILVYSATGSLRAKALIEAVHFSLAHFSGTHQKTPFCTVQFKVELNGVQIGKGEAQF